MNIQSLLAKYCKKVSLLWYGNCWKLFGKMKKEANFGNIVAEIVTKKYERGERNDVMIGVRKNWISVMWLPKCCCPDEVPKGEKCSKGKINKNQLWQPSCQNWREKKGIMGGKRKIVATKLPKL